jgi:hypothetical protein
MEKQASGQARRTGGGEKRVEQVAEEEEGEVDLQVKREELGHGGTAAHVGRTAAPGQA